MKERRSRVAEERKREERERLEHFGLLNGKSSLLKTVCIERVKTTFAQVGARRLARVWWTCSDRREERCCSGQGANCHNCLSWDRPLNLKIVWKYWRVD